LTVDKPKEDAAEMDAKTPEFGKATLLSGESATPIPAEKLQAYFRKEMALAACAAPRKTKAAAKINAAALSSTANKKEARGVKTTGTRTGNVSRSRF
jgi:hypothetical protein